ncbi:glucose-repressible protein [Emericellopsis cladophorae]|uniref:Glucose-repressible protein n=1 Tax=Emericellopsis cladophorae TaxID=2686198 RepID=A0A9Q0BG32_9HYPO|nr:glucose-repressible protein [Emericellopsis cladophorae]KAI6782929.1 glucose-repressible protein [Emericellopsis cladophorae]
MIQCVEQIVTLESVKQAANSASETVQQGLRGTSKEANKEVAKDSNAPVGTRASAAKDAVGDKAEEQKHSSKSEAHKQQI